MIDTAKAIPLALSILMLAGCGGGTDSVTTVPEPATQAPPVSGGGDQQDDQGDQDNEDDGATAASDLEQFASQFDPQVWIDQAAQFADADGDGVQDTLDTDPNTKPILSDPRSSQSLTIEESWSVIDGRRVDDVALQGYPLRLSVSGLPAAAGNSVWVSFQTGAGYRAVRATVTGGGLLEVMPEPDALGAHVIAGSSRGTDYSLRSLSLGEPVLFPPDGSVEAASTFEIAGRDLADIEEVTLSGEVLTIEDRSASSLRVRLPSAARGNQLVAATATGRSNPVNLDLRQDVTISVVADLPLAQGETLEFRTGGDSFEIAPNSSVTVSIPAWDLNTIYFDIVADGDNIRSYGLLQAVSWPGDDSVQVSVQSTLLSRLTGIRDYLPDEARGNDWENVRASLEQTLTTPAAQDYLVQLTDHVAGRESVPDDRMVSAVARAYEDLIVRSRSTASQKVAGESTVSFFEPLTTDRRKELDSIVASVINSPDPEGEATRQVFGNENSQVSVLRHTDNLVEVEGLFTIGGCSYSPEEVQWRQAHAIATASRPYRALWDSDLCIQVDGKVVVSAAVFKPGKRNPDVILSEMAQATFANQNPPEVLRRHARPSFVDLAYQYTAGEHGGYYLRGDDGTPLCHMETCYIELITSGYGLFDTTPLSPSQKEVVRVLRIRMWLEALIPYFLDLAGQGDSSVKDQIKACYVNGLLGDAQLRDAIDNLIDQIDDDRDKIKANPITELGAALDATVSDWARKYMTGQLGTQAFDCITKFVSGVATPDLEGQIKAKWPKSKRIFAFLSVFEFVSDLGSAVLTPERFVFKINPRARIRSMSPTNIDLYDATRNLVFEGDWLAVKDLDAQTPCSGEGWCPNLVVRDRFGKEATVPFLDTDIFTVPNCGLACVRLEMPFSSLTLPGLAGGPVDIELAINDPDGDAYSSYPGNRLRVPVPGNSESLKTFGALGGVNPPIAKSGEVVTVLGSRLSVYGDNALWDLRSEADPSVVYTMPLVEQVDEADSSVRLRVLERVPRGLYRVTLKPGFDATKDNLPPLETPDPIFINSAPLPVVAVGDQGVDKDDTLRIELLDLNGNPISRESDITRPITSTIPLNRGNGEGEAYSVVLYWDDATDSLGEPIDITALVRQVAVTCVDAGNDNLCTYGVRSARDRICLTEFSNATPFQARKIPEGRTDPLRLARPTELGGFETCSDAFNNP